MLLIPKKRTNTWQENLGNNFSFFFINKNQNLLKSSFIKTLQELLKTRKIIYVFRKLIQFFINTYVFKPIYFYRT